jgi:transposase
MGISARQMRRWRKRLEEQGPKGLLDRRRGTPSPRRIPKERAEEVLSLYQDQYFDLNVRHFHEKLREDHQIGLSYTWVKQALQEAGLVKRKAKRGVHRKRRERRPLPGLACRSQRTSAGDRALRRAQASRQRLGGTANMYDPFPKKPKGMHWRTYQELRCLHDDANAQSWPGWLMRRVKDSHPSARALPEAI